MKTKAQKYLDGLDSKSAWVFTKQETDFNTAILATRLFSEIPNIDDVNIETYFIDHHSKYGIETNRHRMLVIPQLFGLLTKTPFYERGGQYNKEKPTDVFDAFNKLLVKDNGKLKIEEGPKYNTLKTEQILKLKIHAIIDTANNNEDCYILPVIFIYKVLKELQKYNINEITIDQLYTYVMTCKKYDDYIDAVEFIKHKEPVSGYVNKYKSVSRVLTLIKKNINLFNITSNSISINPVFDEYFYKNFMLKYDLEELSDILYRDVDYSYFLYNVQGFDINLIDEPSKKISTKLSSQETKEVIKNETSEEEIDDEYESKIDNIDEENVNKDVAIGAHNVAPLIQDRTKISKKYRRNPLLGKIAIQNAYYCCEKNVRHETFISKKTKKNFMEAHHLVPVKYQKEIWEKYGVNVDCVENILSLCPTCHRAFHNGSDEVKKIMIADMYEKLLPRYKSIKFDIPLEEILNLYKIKKI